MLCSQIAQRITYRLKYILQYRQNTIFLICETQKNICRKLDLTVLKVEKLEMKVNNTKLVTQNDGSWVSHSARSSLFYTLIFILKTQPVFTSSKLAIETLKQDVKYVQS